MKKLISLIFAGVLSCALPVYAEHDGSMGHHCERMGQKAAPAMPADTNGDGNVDWEEAHDAFVQHFDEMDVNQDGVLSADETKGCCMSGTSHKGCKDGKSCKHHHSGAHDKGSKAFNAADKDQDGTLDRKEARKLKKVFKNFDAIDVDKDGTVDRDEVHNFMMGH